MIWTVSGEHNNCPGPRIFMKPVLQRARALNSYSEAFEPNRTEGFFSRPVKRDSCHYLPQTDSQKDTDTVIVKPEVRMYITNMKPNWYITV